MRRSELRQVTPAPWDLTETFREYTRHEEQRFAELVRAGMDSMDNAVADFSFDRDSSRSAFALHVAIGRRASRVGAEVSVQMEATTITDRS
jgi:hypothetical protein